MREPAHIGESLITMVTSAPWIKAIVGVLTAFVAYILPTQTLRDMALALIVFIVADTLTGIFAARADGQAVSSAKFSRLLTKLVGYSSAVIVVTLAVKVIPGFAEAAPAGAGLTMGFALTTEGISIFENLDRMGIPVPEFIKSAFKSSQEKNK